MMLDQQYPMEHAFRGPAKVLTRFGTFDPGDRRGRAEAFAALCSMPPAIHRFPGSMAARLQELARIVLEQYDGHAERIWTEAADGKDLLSGVQALPGFGAQKAKIFVALLAKQLDVRPEGWEQVGRRLRAGGLPLGRRRRRPGQSLQKVRDHKKQKKAAAKAQADARRPAGVDRPVVGASPGSWQDELSGS